MNKQHDSEGIIYNVKRAYKSIYTIDEFIGSIIRSHYYDEYNSESNSAKKDNKSAQHTKCMC